MWVRTRGGDAKTAPARKHGKATEVSEVSGAASPARSWCVGTPASKASTVQPRKATAQNQLRWGPQGWGAERGSYRLDSHDLEPRPAPVGLTDPTMRRSEGGGRGGGGSLGVVYDGGGAGRDYLLGGPRALVAWQF